MYNLQDLKDPIRITSRDVGYSTLENALYDAFRDQYIFTGSHDLPYIDYNPKTGEVNIEDQVYTIDKDLQTYLLAADAKFYMIPLPLIRIKTVTLKITHPKADDKGNIEIECINEPIN